jgi:chromosomal replication initiator protein
MDEIWKKTLEEIELEISKPRFVTFFKQTRLLSIKEGVATIAAPNYMATSHIEKNYYSLIKRVLDKQTGDKLSLVFTTYAKKQQGVEIPGPLFTNTVIQNAVKKQNGRIRQDYNFDSFAVSDSNQLAYTASLAVAQDLGGKYNPLFLYGTVGVGKTHLMHSIANVVYKTKPNATVIYLTTEEFTNEVVEAIQFKTTQQLRRKFRNIDLLLLDDIQFLTGKEKVQEELFHTFNSLIDKKGQVIFSSDRPPHEIKKLEPRLASRFEGGLAVDIEPPDFELRTAILLIKSGKYGFSLTPEFAKKIAEKITDSRALEGFLLKMNSFLTSSGSMEVNEEVIDKCFGKTKLEKAAIHPDDVITVVCNYFNVKTTQLKGARREASLVKPRHICMYLLREEFGLTLVEIGNLLGGRDHTTVMHGVEKIKALSINTASLNEEILLIKRAVGEGYLQ